MSIWTRIVSLTSSAWINMEWHVRYLYKQVFIIRYIVIILNESSFRLTQVSTRYAID